jgi:hypothetical protein
VNLSSAWHVPEQQSIEVDLQKQSQERANSDSMALDSYCIKIFVRDA